MTRDQLRGVRVYDPPRMGRERRRQPVRETIALTLATIAIGGAPARSLAAGPDESLPDIRRVAINGERLSGFVLPVVPITADLTLKASRAWTWTVDDTKRIELRGDVRIRMSSYYFTADEAEIWINRLPVRNADGTQGEVSQVAIYFLEATEPTRRAGFGAAGRNLLVTAATRGSIALDVTQRIEQAPPPSELLGRGQARLAQYLRGVLGGLEEGSERLSPVPVIDKPTRPKRPPPEPGEPIVAATAPPRGPLPESVELPTTTLESGAPIIRPEGIVSFAAREIVIDETAGAVTVEGGVYIDYQSDIAQGPQSLELRAERGVVFLAPDALKAVREQRRDVRASDVLGVYLEGGVVATDGRYLVRGSKVYYDFEHNRATIVDAVLRTYARLGRMVTLYARAKEMRQLSAKEFEAQAATVSTSEFFVPHLSIGAERVTITEPPEGVVAPSTIVAEHITFRAGHVPFFGLPYYEGTTEPSPFRGAEAGVRSDYGAEILTDWDLFHLMGTEPPEGLDAQLTVGGYTERGPAVGTEFRYERARMSGALDLFGLYDFGGTDRTSSGLDVDKGEEFRGIIDGEFQTALSSTVTLQTQLAYISDQTFVTTFRRDDFSNRREYESSVYLISQEENTALTMLGKYGLNGFLSNSYLLASRGYQVDRMPDVAYRRIGDDIFDGVIWTQTWQATMMSLRPTKGSPQSLGIPAAAFGLTNPATSLPDAFEAAGYRDDSTLRAYTRHEFSYPFGEDNWNIVPFVFGSAAAYMWGNFDSYAAQPEDVRLMLGGGARSSMRFVHIDDKAQSRLFDINRIRHIVEPNATLFYAYDSVDPGTFPIYDQEIEGALGGAIAQVGVRQQWQTQRGGPGAWESVDFLTVDAGVVLNPEDDDFQPTDLTNPLQIAQSALPSFYGWRPELSQYGSHVYGLGIWQISDTLTLAGTGAVLLEDRAGVTDPDAVLRNLAKGSVGIEMRHTPDVSSYVEYRLIAPTDSQLIQFGVVYQLGKKHVLAFSPQYDLNAGELRKIQGSIVRTFPDFNLALTAGYDLIEDQTTASLRLSIPPETAPVRWSGTSPFPTEGQ